MAAILRYRDKLQPHVNSIIPEEHATSLQYHGSQSLMGSIQSLAKTAAGITYKLLRAMIKRYAQRRLNVRLKRETHEKQAQFMLLVLQKLPFLYNKSQEVEKYHWIKIAYELKKRGQLIPDLIRYQVGPTFFVSFGSIANQIKREFFLMVLNNDRSYPPINFRRKNFEDSHSLVRIKTRQETLNETYEFFTFEEMRQIILSGDRISSDYDKESLGGKEEDKDILSDWYNSWGWVYETGLECYRALCMEESNYVLELTVLDYLKQMQLSKALLQGTESSKNCTLNDLILEKETLINEVYLPEVRLKKKSVGEEMKACKKNSQRYYDLMNY